MPSTKQPIKDRQRYIDDKYAKVHKAEEDSNKRGDSVQSALSRRGKSHERLVARSSRAATVVMGNQGQWSEQRVRDSIDRATKGNTYKK